jgi:hypothetical protein
MVESLTITRSRRHRAAAARGSSRVLISGLDLVAAGRQAVPDLPGPAQAVHGAARCLHHRTRTADELPGDQKRDQDVGQPAEPATPADQVILLAAA